ncbi:hypothetical protein OROGR_021761 [Orobanche gracilis]
MADEKTLTSSEGSSVGSAGTASAASDSHKRKLDDLELSNEPELPANSELNSNADALNNGTQEDENGGADESEAKRPRFEINGDNVSEADRLVPQSGHRKVEKKDVGKEEEESEPEEEPHEESEPEEEEESEQPESADASVLPVDDEEPPKEPLETITHEPPKEPLETVTQEPIKEPLETVTQEPPEEPLDTVTQEPLREPLATINQEPPKESLETVSQEPASNENDKNEIGSFDELGQPMVQIEVPVELPREGDVPVYSTETRPGSDGQILSRKMEVPNDKVGVLIGKAGDTIRSLQDNSGAKIQIMRDADADPRSTTRPLELVGTLEDINKAEKLIKDVIAEADAGGSPSLVARGFNTAQAASGGEQVEIQVPIEKVGLIIGKGGETIRNLQTTSGARIQLLQQNLCDGEQSKERIVRITGNKKQIEIAREMIKDVMNQTIRPSPLSSGHSQQGYRPPRGPVAPQWGPRGPHHSHSGYDYPQRGPYPSQNSQYPPPSYGNYPPHQAPRSNFGPPSWEHRPPASMHVPSSQGNYNYGQHPGQEYGQHPSSYSQTHSQPYSHGYNEAKYDNHQHFGPQPTPYTQGCTHSYGPPQDPYGKQPPVYGMQQPQVPHSQPYGQPRPNQPGEVPYQGPGSSAPLYGQNMPPQQPYPYASSGPMQQTYHNPPPYGSVPTSDGYGHPPATASSGPGYGQPVAGYGQAGAQQPPPASYPQAGATGGYGSFPPSQPTGYAEQPPAANNSGYGYNQGPADPASYGAPQGPGAAYPATGVGQAGYAQPTQTQPGYDQSGGYGSVSAPVVYGKIPSPQPGYAPPLYDASQIYGGHR